MLNKLDSILKAKSVGFVEKPGLFVLVDRLDLTRAIHRLILLSCIIIEQLQKVEK